MRKTKSGFTIVELLIVIVVIAILATISIMGYNGFQNRAKDTKRVADISNIKKALIAYDAVNGGVRSTVGTGAYTNGTTYSGWDASVSPNWLAFLRADSGSMPVDPTNTMSSTNAPAGGNRIYYYYCYTQGTGPSSATQTGSYVVLGYRTESNQQVNDTIPVAACLV